VLRNARHVIAAGSYPAAEAERAAGRELPTTIVPPGVDTESLPPAHDRPSATSPSAVRAAPSTPSRGRGLPAGAAQGVRHRDPGDRPMRDTHPDVVLAIAGTGSRRRPADRLAAELGAPVRFLGRVAHDDLPRVYGCADVFTMLCRNRWGGLEQEGFGIVFVEAAACGVPQVAGDSGGAADAVADGETG
jgi:phosphatidyl-myo-inositol dimannoside synthase